MKDLYVFFCFLLVAFCISQTEADSVVLKTKDCGSEDVVVKSVTMSPAIARRGELLFLTTTILSKRHIDKGRFRVRIFKRFFGREWTIFRSENDICNMIQKRECPIRANTEFTTSSTLVIGRLVPYGDYNCKVTYTNEWGIPFACFTFELPFHRPLSDTTPRIKSVF